MPSCSQGGIGLYTAMRKNDEEYKKARCGNKLAHPNYLMALQAAASLRRDSPQRRALLSVYPCEFCGSIHLGFQRVIPPKTRYLRELTERLRNPQFLSRAPAQVVRRAQGTYDVKRAEIVEYCTAVILQGLRLSQRLDLSFLSD